MPFLTELKITEDASGDWKLLEDLVYQGNDDIFTIPAGFITDLASIPPIFKPFFPVYGKYTKAAVMHDCHYIEQHISRKDADGIFRRTMRESTVGKIRRYLMWFAVRIGGSYKKNVDLKEHGL